HYKFNTFIAMFLIISEIYLFLFRTHVIYKINVLTSDAHEQTLFLGEDGKILQ
ncbi:hypothetical protein GPK99_09700, partial [Phocaeicola vulgatus]|nr:hypothetical protein [Phocaeicola vulgatus]